MHLETRGVTTILAAQTAMVTLAEAKLPRRSEAQAQEPDVVVLTSVKLHLLAAVPKAKALKIDRIGRAELLVQSTMTSLKAP